MSMDEQLRIAFISGIIFGYFFWIPITTLVSWLSRDLRRSLEIRKLVRERKQWIEDNYVEMDSE